MRINRQLTTKDGLLDATRARDRWTWVSIARSRAASSLERQRAGSRSGFYLSLPHQQETPEA
ncbi:MAG: hypothetical protein AMJ59_06185 [Gammaproteobacteria bacterium SG8_31]|jgi:hypothetical protein|nr:MAG: hypothetical protein AMJ59_06185 [Gammaproteobacteria bacterium SG8_31]